MSHTPWQNKTFRFSYHQSGVDLVCRSWQKGQFLEYKIGWVCTSFEKKKSRALWQQGSACETLRRPKYSWITLSKITASTTHINAFWLRIFPLTLLLPGLWWKIAFFHILSNLLSNARLKAYIFYFFDLIYNVTWLWKTLMHNATQHLL